MAPPMRWGKPAQVPQSEQPEQGTPVQLDHENSLEGAPEEDEAAASERINSNHEAGTSSRSPSPGSPGKLSRFASCATGLDGNSLKKLHLQLMREKSTLVSEAALRLLGGKMLYWLLLVPVQATNRAAHVQAHVPGGHAQRIGVSACYTARDH